jgi:Voltage gated chloride channel
MCMTANFCSHAVTVESCSVRLVHIGMQMTPGQNLASERDGDHGSILVIAVLALVVGAVSGFVGALFLLLLERADRFRDAVTVWAHSKAFAGFLVLAIVCGAAAAVAAWLVRRYSPHAAGSGIPHVEAVLNEELPQAPFRIMPIKFVAGVKAQLFRWRRPLGIWSARNFGAAGPTAECCLPQAPALAWPPLSMLRSPEPFSCLKNWCGVSSYALR